MKKTLLKFLVVLVIGLFSAGAFAACTEDETKKVAPTAEKKYVKVNADGDEDENGGYVLFGEYPQTIKAEDVTVTETPDSRGYFLGSDGEYYAQVTANHYIASNVDDYENVYKFSDGKTVVNGEVYYFKVEPIKWRILAESEGEALILCEMIIDAAIFDGEANNYKESKIKTFLNETFYNTAFTALQKQIIKLTTVDNSVLSTNPNGKPMQINHGINANACEDTEDYVFVLSEKEITTEDYGFSNDTNNHQNIRKKSTTDYARSVGAYTGMRTENKNLGIWWLRTPYYHGTTYAYSVNYYGVPTQTDLVNTACNGVVPATWIEL